MPELVLSRQDIVALLNEVAGELAEVPGPKCEIVVAGGSYMALLGLRTSTRDVDALNALDERVQTAASAVAARRGLPPDWLNSRAQPWAPATLSREDCSVLIDHEHLLVLGPPPDVIFLMKLNAARAPDLDDLLQLWALTSFSSAAEVVHGFHDAYPNEKVDQYLEDWVQQIIDAAESSRRD